MKTIRVVTLALLVSAVTFIACQKDEVPVNSNTETQVERPWNMISYKGMIERLEDYDKTRKPILEQALGYEDARINFYSIETLENYIAYVKQLSKEKGIEFTGINFVSGAYPKDANYGTPGYQHIMFMPTTNISGKNIGFDPSLSTENKVVTIKEVLASYGYNWVYDSEEDYKNRNVLNKQINANLSNREKKADLDSGAGNLSHIKPPNP
ncbi:hypothetical protein [Tenacibaculum jejuense]|uniref:Probable lipoprotein n=1 Tax=Tenacibaculum jejuense TaxID=584609 RepID=A0A238U524_9FLAO|nr:hypothetical protein [Tenacibaculum jejuense]SNR14309.1 Probable lipoprotein precursor [Tenacibaculum jejuense]